MQSRVRSSWAGDVNEVNSLRRSSGCLYLFRFDLQAAKIRLAEAAILPTPNVAE